MEDKTRWLMTVYVAGIWLAGCEGQDNREPSSATLTPDPPGNRGSTGGVENSHDEADVGTTNRRESDADSGVASREMSLYKSGSRIRARVAQTQDGAQMFLGWYDTEFEEPCTLVAAQDLKLRCLPGYVSAAGTFFSDANCSEPLWDVYNPTGCIVRPATEYALVYGTSGACEPAGLTVRGIGPEYNGPVFSSINGVCRDLDATFVNPYSLYTLGEVINVGRFSEATESVE